MRVRLETAQLLKQISAYHYPGSAVDLAEFTGMHDVSLRRRLKQLAQAGYLRQEFRKVFYPSQGTRERAVYWISLSGQAVVDRYESHRPLDPKPRQRRAEQPVRLPEFSARGIPNSVFALGQMSSQFQG